MKKFFAAIFVFSLAAVCLAAVQYDAEGLFKFNFGGLAGNDSSILILANLESLALSTDYGSVGNSGKVGYIVYDADGAVAARSEALFHKQLQPSNDIVISNLMTGQSIGFFLEQSNGRVEENFMFFERGGNAYLQFARNGSFSGNSEAFMISGVRASAPTGQPLPGALVTLLVGGSAIGGLLGLRRRLKAKA